jgi:hypothetical protein
MGVEFGLVGCYSGALMIIRLETLFTICDGEGLRCHWTFIIIVSVFVVLLH